MLQAAQSLRQLVGCEKQTHKSCIGVCVRLIHVRDEVHVENVVRNAGSRSKFGVECCGDGRH